MEYSKICPKCGNPSSEDIKICPKCGSIKKESLEGFNKNLANEYLTEEAYKLRDPIYRIRMLSKIVFLISLFISSQLISSMNNILFFFFIVFTIYNIAYYIENKFHQLQGILFWIKVLVGAYIGYVIAIFLPTLGISKETSINSLFNPRVMIDNFNNKTSLILISAFAGAISILFIDFIFKYYRKGGFRD